MFSTTPRKKRIPNNLTVVLAVTALVAFSGVAEASVVVNGTEVSAGDYTTGSTGLYNLTNSGVNTIDGGSHWTHNDDGGNGLWKMANRAPTTMTISGGGWLELTGDTSDGHYVFQVGNQGGGVGHMLVTGTGSKVTTLWDVQVGRNESGCTLTIEDGGLVVAQNVVLSRDSGTNNLLRMGRGGILAIEGTGKTETSDFWNGTGEMQYNPSGDGTTWVNITGATGGGVDYTLEDGTGALAGYSVLTMLGGEPPTIAITEIDYDPDAGNLRIRWDSQDGRLYNLRSESDPSVAAPIDWPIFDGHQDLAATPPENTLTFPLPADSERFFVIEGFPAPPVSVLSEDFESGQGDWVPGNSGVPLPDPPGGVSSPTATVWELGTPDPVLLGGPPAAHSGTNCFGTDLDTSYADLTGVFLRSPSINLTTAAGATLTFWRFYDIETGFDWGRVRVLDAADDSEIAVLEETFDGTTNDWEEVSIKLPAEVAGKMVKIEFILATDDVTNNPQAGLYIDDVSVTVP